MSIRPVSGRFYFLSSTLDIIFTLRPLLHFMLLQRPAEKVMNHLFSKYSSTFNNYLQRFRLPLYVMLPTCIPPWIHVCKVYNVKYSSNPAQSVEHFSRYTRPVFNWVWVFTVCMAALFTLTYYIFTFSEKQNVWSVVMLQPCIRFILLGFCVRQTQSSSYCMWKKRKHGFHLWFERRLWKVWCTILQNQ